jgi:hypothetical protein
MFYALYPIGISAEWWLMYRSIEHIGRVSNLLPPLFYFLLALYVPGEFLSSEGWGEHLLIYIYRFLVHVLAYD